MAKVKQMKPLNDTLEDIRSYNKKHNTNLSYGHYITLKRQGKIK